MVIFLRTQMRLRLAGGLMVAMLCSGCVDPKMMQGKKDAPVKEEAATPAAPAAASAPAEPAAPAAPSFPADNTKLVDRKKMLAENPKLVEVENRINATDPLTSASQSYFSIGSRAQLLNLKHAIDLYKAEHEKPPAFAEFEEMIRQANVPLKGIYRWQVYAYDDSTGELCILEDRDYKKREYEKAGRKWEEN